MTLSVIVSSRKTGNWKQRAADLVPAIRNAQETEGRRIVERAKELSQGVFSTDALRRLGHPYRIGGSPPANPAIINRQSGRFAASWKYELKQGQDKRELVVYNDAPWAKFMAGTEKMIARPILEAMQKTERQKWTDSMRSAFASIFRK